jgi:hypothetical protein
MKTGAELIYGQLRLRDGETRFNTLTAAMFYRLLQRLTDGQVLEDTGDFRLWSGPRGYRRFPINDSRTVEVLSECPSRNPPFFNPPDPFHER